MARLRRYKEPLRQVGHRRVPLARRRETLHKQKGKGFWLGFKDLCQCVLP